MKKILLLIAFGLLAIIMLGTALSVVLVENIVGPRMARYSVERDGAGFKKQLDLSGLPAGNYFIHITNGNSRTTQKVLIQR